MTRRHRHLDGTEHLTPAVPAAAVRVPQAPRPGLVDGRVLVVALAVSSPAVYRLAQGMVSLTDVLTRYLLVALGCVAAAALVRWVWPLLAGEPTDRADRTDALRDSVEAELARPGAATDLEPGDPLGELSGGLDELGGLDAAGATSADGTDGAATALLGLGGDEDLLELRDR